MYYFRKGELRSLVAEMVRDMGTNENNNDDKRNAAKEADVES